MSVSAWEANTYIGWQIMAKWDITAEEALRRAEYERGRREGFEMAAQEARDFGVHLRRYDLVARDKDADK